MHVMQTRARRRREGGQALPEFALVAPLLFLLLFGVIQLGLLMASQNGLVNGVRDSARRAATYRVSDQSLTGAIFGAVCTSVETELAARLRKEMPGFDAGGLSTHIAYEWSPDPTNGEYSLIVNVTANYSAPLYVPLVGIVLHPSDPAHFPLSASEQMRVENPPLAPSDISTQDC